MGVNAGQLDRRITLEEWAPTLDGHGQELEGWVVRATVWAAVEERGGGEGFQADQVTQSQSAVFEVRHMANIDPKWSVVYNGQRYDILDIRDPGRRERLFITAEVREKRS